jgi:hypothetical protein
MEKYRLPTIHEFARNMTLKDARRVLELQIGDYSNIRSRFYNGVEKASQEYLTTNQTKAAFIAMMVALMASSWGQTQSFIYRNEDYPDANLDAWLNKEQEAERGYINDLAERLTAFKEGVGDKPTTTHKTVQEVAIGYQQGLDRIFNNMKVATAKDIALTFGGIPGVKQCEDCKSLTGVMQPARTWYESQQVPPLHLKCRHFLYDQYGVLYTM